MVTYVLPRLFKLSIIRNPPFFNLLYTSPSTQAPQFQAILRKPLVISTLLPPTTHHLFAEHLLEFVEKRAFIMVQSKMTLSVVSALAAVAGMYNSIKDKAFRCSNFTLFLTLYSSWSTKHNYCVSLRGHLRFCRPCWQRRRCRCGRDDLCSLRRIHSGSR